MGEKEDGKPKSRTPFVVYGRKAKRNGSRELERATLRTEQAKGQRFASSGS